MRRLKAIPTRHDRKCPTPTGRMDGIGLDGTISGRMGDSPPLSPRI